MLLSIRISCGLPNLYGHIEAGANWDIFSDKACSGVFSSPGRSNWVYGQGGYVYNWSTIEFHASSYDSIYGSSNTVTPVSLTTKYYVKY